MKALRPNLKDRSESPMKHKKLKRSSGTFGKKTKDSKKEIYYHSLKPKKQDDYIAKDNGTRLGRIDINAINHRRFNGTCNACGKKGHKEADCRSRKTCEFCGKKGHNETHCYTKKNAKKPKTPKDKA
ncbi:hypothetical protein MKX08_009570 [Trichoderma sp. CBMAI-0020]|nr:hypothetical protein MKX08_009570 [Trichoderma sp. CBMAI-0020]